MDGQRRRELDDSVRLAVHGERWFLLDLVLAVVGFVGWVAATGALAALGAREAGVSLAIEQGSTQTLGLLGAAVVGWIVLTLPLLIGSPMSTLCSGSTPWRCLNRNVVVSTWL